MSTKTLEELQNARLRERAAARARFGDRSVYDVLFTVRTRLRMLSDFAGAKAEEADGGDLSSEGWTGLDGTLQDAVSELAMLEDALPAEISNWRPSQHQDEGDQ